MLLLFRISLQRRLRMLLLAEPTHCPSCGMNLDVWADHALVCSCKVDRTIRHNAIRDSAFRFAKAAGLNPVREKPGLLPPRPDQESIQEPRHANGRRPADIWLPRFWDGGAVALDFGVTSGLRVGELHTSALDYSRVTADYENFKRSHLSTGVSSKAFFLRP